MVISKGQEWGVDVDVPPNIPHARSDSELVSLIVDSNGVVRTPPGEVTATGGDLWKTVGGTSGSGPSSRGRRLPIDLGWVSVDGAQRHYFVAHAVMRTWSWLGPVAVAMNAAWYGSYYLGPRAHPNDGLLDVTQGELPLRQLWEGRQRARSGTHLPHPRLQVSRDRYHQVEFDRPRRLWLDGVRTPYRGTTFELGVITDAFALVV